MNTYKASGTVIFAVEAENKANAFLIIQQLIDQVKSQLPTGVTMRIGEHNTLEKTDVR